MGPAMRNAFILLAAFVAAPTLAQGPLRTAERGT
jgi:hypothetical protein